jgi:hypothetical protein
MALSDRLSSTYNGSQSGHPCSVGVLIEELQEQPEELTALNLMLYGTKGRGWTAGRVYETLRAEGYIVSEQQINRHRGGRCRCRRDV